jgi:flagellin
MVGKTSNSQGLNNRLINTQESQSKTLNKIASGKKILTASDDPAGLAVLNAMESLSRGLMQQISNRQDEISMIQTAEGSLGNTGEMLQRINELSVQASNGTLTDSDRQNIQFEIDQLSQQIDMNASNSQYNTKNLLDGSLNVQLQNGNDLTIPSMSSEALGISKIDVTSQAGASSAIGITSQAISNVSSQRGTLGAVSNGISSELEGLNSQLLSTIESQSRIGDADIAMELINLSREELQSKVALKAFKFQDDARSTVLNLLG